MFKVPKLIETQSMVLSSVTGSDTIKVGYQWVALENWILSQGFTIGVTFRIIDNKQYPFIEFIIKVKQ